ncbi:zinc finger, CCHC-type containing protein [Tanacetum coccineum]
MIQPSSSKIAEDEVEGTDDVPGPSVPRKSTRTRKAKSLSGLIFQLNLVDKEQEIRLYPNVNIVFIMKRIQRTLWGSEAMASRDVAFWKEAIQRWINNMEDHSSTSGWVFLLGGGAISWASKKQTCITSSTMESEFVALAAAGNEADG